MTTTSRQAESGANAALAALLQGMMRGASVRAEHTQVVEGQPALRPDIIITDNRRAPVVVEAEYMPARSVEAEAVERLALPVVGDTRVIEAAIALRYPEDLESARNIAEALKAARSEYCVHYKDGGRFPASGWISGGASDLADLICLVSVSESEVDAATDILEQGIDRAVAVLDDVGSLRPRIVQEIERLLGMPDPAAARRMACAIVANALIFHESIAGMHPNADVQPLNLLWGTAADNPQSKISAAWDDILQINYWAIFAIARDIVNQLPAYDAAQILDRLRDTAQSINAGGAIFAHDLTGRIFQRLIADRKYLATFYTLPASAALLARLAAAKLNGVDWADANAIGELRVADFTCGTGALLSAVYEQFAGRHERAGGDPTALHKAMMEDVLYGCDVMPSAIHISGATLSGIQPGLGFDLSRLYAMPYGRQADGSIQIGSLELLQSSSVMTLFNMNDPARRTGSRGEETASQVPVEFPDESFDLVIMNPPFTRSTNHGGAHHDVVNPAFAAFGAPAADQTQMGDRLNRFGANNCYHGNAGLASAFAAVANRKLRPGGVFAFVLPLVAAAGQSWDKFRRMLAAEYTDISVISIAAANFDSISFSADTGLGECLIIARKRVGDERKAQRAQFTSLRQRPQDIAQASIVATAILDNPEVRRIEDGPYGGEPLSLGAEKIGETLDMPQTADGKLSAVRLYDAAVAQTAYSLTQSTLWLPAQPQPLELKMAQLGSVGKRGLVSRDIIEPPTRGPFDKIEPSATATYPALWNHNARKETRIICEPDSQLQVRRGLEDKAAAVWNTASRAHHNVEFGFASQPLCVAITEFPSIGGRAWPNIQFADARFDYAFALWGNSTLGILMHWWHASLQHAGRGAISIRAAESLPILDLRALTDAQLATAQEIFDEFRELELQPAYLADADPNRALLDRRVVCDMLGFDDAVYEGVRMLAAKWCAEPSVHGGKRRPVGAGLVV